RLCATDAALWQDALRAASAALYGGTEKAWHEIEVGRIALGRLKMLWSSLRSSLPAVFFAPQLLRSRSASELLQGIDTIAKERGIMELSLRHNPSHDWMYAGEAKPTDEETVRREP